jgi:hypothetical protein
MRRAVPDPLGEATRVSQKRCTEGQCGTGARRLFLGMRGKGVESARNHSDCRVIAAMRQEVDIRGLGASPRCPFFEPSETLP